MRSQLHVDVVREQPLIWVVDGLLSPEMTAELRELLDQQDLSGFKKTDLYIDDMFDQRRATQEDASLLVSMLQSGNWQLVPERYRADPLRSFIWLASRHRDKISREDFESGLMVVARRAWCTRWDPNDITRSGFTQSAGRWKVPEAVLRCLAPMVVDVLGTGAQGLPGSQELPGAGSNISWALRDMTVVRYQEGESQVPHVDTSDVTMLVYLSDVGGRTCFPKLDCSVEPAKGRVLVFCSTLPLPARYGGFAGSAYGMPNDITTHYGSLPEEPGGGKLIVQLLFAAVNESLSLKSWQEALCGDAVRRAVFSRGQRALPVGQPPLPSSPKPPRWTLALAKERCCHGCDDFALDVDLDDGRGGPRRCCIHCWQKRLTEARER